MKQTFELRSLKTQTTSDHTGGFEGYLAVFGNCDNNGDIIDKGAFTKTLQDLRQKKSQIQGPYLFPVLWQHDLQDPIGGVLDAKEDNNGLYIVGELDLDVPHGQQAYSGMQKGYMRGLSIGYNTIQSYWDAQHVRHLTNIQLWEGSAVTFPANELAQVAAVKRAQTLTAPSQRTPRMARAYEQLRNLYRESATDPEPFGRGNAAHFAWAVRENRRRQARRLWEAQLG